VRRGVLSEVSDASVEEVLEVADAVEYQEVKSTGVYDMFCVLIEGEEESRLLGDAGEQYCSHISFLQRKFSAIASSSLWSVTARIVSQCYVLGRYIVSCLPPRACFVTPTAFFDGAQIMTPSPTSCQFSIVRAITLRRSKKFPSIINNKNNKKWSKVAGPQKE